MAYTKKFSHHSLSAQFPAVADASSGSALYHFDSAATACTLAPVIAAMNLFYERAHGSVHRGIYEGAERTTSQYEEVRAKVAHFIRATSSREIIFTAGATDSLNTVAYTWAQHILSPGDGILITQAEHHAHYVLWHEMARRTGAHVYVLPIDPITYSVDITGLDGLLAKSIRVVAVSLTSNVIGPLWGIGNHLLDKLIARARAVGAGIVIDAAQAVAHQGIDVATIDCDFLAFSVHKMGGPTGLGVLYAREEMHGLMKPYRFGGGMVSAVVGDLMTWQRAPHCFEAGTPPIAQVIGLGALLDFYAAEVDFHALVPYEAALCVQLIGGLLGISGLHFVGNLELLAVQGHVVSFYVDGIHAHDLAASLGQYGCSVRAGDHCAQPLAVVWQQRATVRVSFFMYNTPAQVSYLIDAISTCIEQWRKAL